MRKEVDLLHHLWDTCWSANWAFYPLTDREADKLFKDLKDFVDVDLVRRTRIPSDWGLEVGMLADVFRNCAPKSICQSELCEQYDHKHQELSTRDPEKGLNRMATDIAKSVFRTVASEGIKLDSGLFDTLLSACSSEGNAISWGPPGR